VVADLHTRDRAAVLDCVDLDAEVAREEARSGRVELGERQIRVPDPTAAGPSSTKKKSG
jgi:hypothetical protein